MKRRQNREADKTQSTFYSNHSRVEQKTMFEQQMEEARRRASALTPNFKTPWHSFWSWAIINDHVRLAFATISMVLIAAVLMWEACFPEPETTESVIETTWQLAWGALALTVALIVGVVIAWRRWEHKVRAPKPPPRPQSQSTDLPATAEAERIRP